MSKRHTESSTSCASCPTPATKAGRAARAADASNATRSTVIFEKSGCRALLRKHPHLKGHIEQTVASQMANGLFKSKFATNARWHGLPIWECRVNEKSVGSVRVAFAVQGESATVLFVSPELQKRAFAAELERFLERSHA